MIKSNREPKKLMK